MKLEDFEKLIKNLKEASERTHEIYNKGVSLTDYDELFYKIIEPLLVKSFGQQGADWIEWYVLDRDSKASDNAAPLQAWDENGNEICQNIESLWKTVLNSND
jgi:hypothetical protein